MIERRVLLQWAAGTLIVLHAVGADAQVAVSHHTIGYLGWESRPPDLEPLRVMLQRLAELGYVEGRNLTVDARYASGQLDELHVQAKALVAARPRLIMVRSVGIAQVVLEQTKTLPVVTMTAGQLEAEPRVQSLARPGGNLTGMQVHSPEVIGKRLQLLRDVVPGLRRVLVLRGVPFEGPGLDLYVRSNDEAAARLGIQARYVQFQSAQDLERLFAAVPGSDEQAVLAWSNPHLNAHRPLIAKLALRHRVPVLYDVRYPGAPVDEFLVYSARIADVVREAAGYVDKILKGADPAELPIGTAKTFELVVNLRTAKAIGLKVPRELLLRADKVIE